jgi:hypothetical protein
MIAGAGRPEGVFDDWKPVLDGIWGAIESGMNVRGGQGGTEVTEEGVVATEVTEGSVGIFIRP